MILSLKQRNTCNAATKALYPHMDHIVLVESEIKLLSMRKSNDFFIHLQFYNFVFVYAS